MGTRPLNDPCWAKAKEGRTVERRVGFCMKVSGFDQQNMASFVEKSKRVINVERDQMLKCP